MNNSIKELNDHIVELQLTIIGSIIISGNLIGTNGFISYKNFQDYTSGPYEGYHLQKIYKVLEMMNGKEVIDHITLSSKLLHYYKNSYVNIIADATGRVVNTTHLNSHCLMLLELDIRNKFIALMKYYSMDNNVQDYQRLILEQSVQEVEFDNIDTHIAISAVIHQLIHYNFHVDIINEFKEFEEAIIKKTDAIKCDNRLILTYFNEYAVYIKNNCTDKEVEANNLLLDCMISIYLNKSIKPAALKILKQVKQAL